MTPLLSLLALIGAGIGVAMFLPGYRLRLAIARPFPLHFSKILRRNIPQFSKMSPELQGQLKRLIKQFLFEKKFIGCDDFEIDDEVRVTIAAKASMLLLNRPTRVYPDLKFVLVYPSAFIVPRSEMGLGGVVTHANQTLSGESWSDGRVVLAWDHVQRRGALLADGHDVVLHEFAHQLDSETGGANGAPALMSQAHSRRWSEVMSAEFSRLQHAAVRPQHAQQHTHHSAQVSTQTENVLDHYGATNPAEFFAVATETFFGKTWQMARYHPELFEQFRAYYQVDPRDWQ
ncbi:zinc-dependent peptidase [soil metagenome]